MRITLGIIIALITCVGCKHEDSTPTLNIKSSTTLYIVGSSTMELMIDEFIKQSKDLHIEIESFAQSGEKIYTNCLRIGALPGNVKFNNPILAIDLNNYLTTDWPIDLAMRPFEVSINNIDGLIYVDNKGYYFKANSESQQNYIDTNTFYPITSKVLIKKDSVFILNLGKNDLISNHDNENLYTKLNSCINYIRMNYSDKIYLINHFTSTDANEVFISNVNKFNKILQTNQPSQYLDLNSYLLSDQVWADTQINPNEQDLSNQIHFKLPPSLARDNIHLNTQANITIVSKIYDDLIEYNWLK